MSNGSCVLGEKQQQRKRTKTETQANMLLTVFNIVVSSGLHMPKRLSSHCVSSFDAMEYDVSL